MPLTVTRYNVEIDGELVQNDAGAIVMFDDAAKAYDTLDEFTKAAVAAKDAGAVRIAALEQDLGKAHDATDIAVRDLVQARERVAALEQGIKQAQADLNFVSPTDAGAKRAELEKKIDELKAMLSTLQ